MMDCFSPTFQNFLSEHKTSIKRESFNILIIGLTLNLSSRAFLLGMTMVDWLQSLKQFFINVSYHILVASLTLMALL